MRYFITGATGLLGRQVVARLRALEPQAHIGCLVRSTEASMMITQAGAEPIHGSLEDEDALRRGVTSSEYVIHLAGATHERDEASYYRVNADGTARLVRIAAAAAVRRFVFASSRAIHAACGAYALSKQRAEEAIRASQLRYTIVRFAEVYGPQTGEGISQLFRLVRRSLVVPVLRGVRLAPVHLSDAVEALIRCVQQPAAEGKIYTIAGPRSYSLEECAQLIATALGVRRVLVPIPLSVARLVGRCVGAPDQIDRLQCHKDDDITPARRDLGFAPRSFEEGVRCLL